VNNCSNRIKEKALELGFMACGIAQARKLTEEEGHLQHYIEKQFFGEMGFMKNHFQKRLDPSLLFPGAKSVIVVLANYYPGNNISETNGLLVSKYALGADYHFVVKKLLAELFEFIQKEISPANGRIFTDSAPVLEKAWAVQAGLGWIGKNGLLINPNSGSYHFIGEIITDLELGYDEPFVSEYCGNCTKCLTECPTNALVTPRVLNAQKCISYLTVEYKEIIPAELRPALKNRVFGCDICQDVCPWNKKAKKTNIPEFEPIKDIVQADLKWWQQLDEQHFDELFQHSAFKRVGYTKIKSNIDGLNIE
jgi:epoxyqueuosine reductase